ncbi:MAG: Cof-type HAD-IIB family hydrolase [Candidatus Muiribacteriota bacterium]
MYKLLALDLDGTTLDSNYNIPDENIKAIKKLIENEVKVVIITGRMYAAVKPVLKKLNLKTPVACYNGAVIYDENGKCISFTPLEYRHQEVISSITGLKENNAVILFFKDEEVIAPFYDENVKEYEDRTHTKALIEPEVCRLKFPSTKIIFSSLNYDFINKIRDDFSEKLKDKVYITNSMKRYVEFLNIKISKGKALKKIAGIYNIALEDTVVIGDNNNDAEMFLDNVYKVAVENATDKLKEKADFITLSNNSAGVAYAVDKIFF